jgi:hypothetical protein
VRYPFTDDDMVVSARHDELPWLLCCEWRALACPRGMLYIFAICKGAFKADSTAFQHASALVDDPIDQVSEEMFPASHPVQIRRRKGIR